MRSAPYWQASCCQRTPKPKNHNSKNKKNKPKTGVVSADRLADDLESGSPRQQHGTLRSLYLPAAAPPSRATDCRVRDHGVRWYFSAHVHRRRNCRRRSASRAWSLGPQRSGQRRTAHRPPRDEAAREAGGGTGPCRTWRSAASLSRAGRLEEARLAACESRSTPTWPAAGTHLVVADMTA